MDNGFQYISERKQIHEELAKDESRWRMLLSTRPMEGMELKIETPALNSLREGLNSEMPCVREWE